jgi:hypothetical protein
VAESEGEGYGEEEYRMFSSTCKSLRTAGVTAHTCRSAFAAPIIPPKAQV